MKADTQVKQVQKELETLNAKVKDLETKKQKLEEELNTRQGEIDQILARLALGEVEEESKVQREIRERQEHLREIEDRLRAFNLALEELSRRIEEKKKELEAAERKLREEQAQTLARRLKKLGDLYNRTASEAAVLGEVILLALKEIHRLRGEEVLKKEDPVLFESYFRRVDHPWTSVSLYPNCEVFSVEPEEVRKVFKDHFGFEPEGL